MDHYKVLGVDKSASKDEIKQAFRKLAMQFHPDKHSHSAEHLKYSATLKFKQLSEAYDTLVDDRKRADYNFRAKSCSYNNTNYRYSNAYNSGNSYGNYGYGYTGGSSARRGGGTVFNRFETGLRYLTTRAFLLNATFIGILVGGVYIVDAGGKALWKMHNPGKSFEEAMECVEKVKADKD